jgi:hypothetical protein
MVEVKGDPRHAEGHAQEELPYTAPGCTEPLRPGDILLSLGKLVHARVIREISGGFYSHASIWTGDKVLEATIPRVHEEEPAKFEERCHFIDAYRHVGAEGREKEIVERARAYLERDYGKLDLLLASAVGTFTAWVKNESPWIAYNVQYDAGRVRHHVSELRELIFSTQKGVTCVELVARAHLEAGIGIKVKLNPGGYVNFKLLPGAIKSLWKLSSKGGLHESDGSAERRLAALEANAEWAADLHVRIRAKLPPPDARINVADLEAPLPLLQEIELIAGETFSYDSWDAALVTPHQLAESSSLRCLGRLPQRFWA